MCKAFIVGLFFTENGTWSIWTEWGNCSASCASGSMSRTRVCTGPFYGGLDCQGSATDTSLCNEHPCPGIHYY